MKFNQGFFDNTTQGKFKLWIPITNEQAREGKLLQQASFFKMPKNKLDMTKRHFYLTEKYLYYKKSIIDSRIRGGMLLKNVRLEYSVPKGYKYPKKNFGNSSEEESLNKKKATEKTLSVSSEDSLTKNFFSIRLIKNMKYTEIFTEREGTFITWMNELKKLVIQTDFHDSYNVTKILGKGSFARVYLAQNRTTGEEFAVKAFSKEYIESQDKGKQSLILEIEILKELNHPNVINFYEIHETKNSLYVVMEVLSGG